MTESAHHGAPAEHTHIEPRVLNRLGRNIYCHHCHQLVEDMIILGRDVWRRVVYSCSCGGEIRITVAKSDSYCRNWRADASTDRRCKGEDYRRRTNA